VVGRCCFGRDLKAEENRELIDWFVIFWALIYKREKNGITDSLGEKIGEVD